MKYLSHLNYSLLWAAVIVFCPSVLLADAWPVARGPSRERQPYKFDRDRLKKAPKEFFDNAAAIMVYYGVTHLVEADGTVETIIHEITLLNSRKGVSRLGEYRGITYDPAFQKLTLNEARIIKADGSTVAIEPRHLKLRDAVTNYEVYDPEKELVISFPALQVGDLYEVKWTTRGKHPEDAGHFFTRYHFGSVQYPIVNERLMVRLPQSKPLKYAVRNGTVKTAIHEKDKHRYYQWTLNNHPALPRDEDLPSREELRLQLMCSTFPTWEAVGKWKANLRKDCWDCSPAIKALVKKITKNLKTPEAKVRALTYWVRRHIRYVSVVSARHRYRPRTPDAVLTNLYGDCKDQGQLLAVMLREIGLSPRLVTLGIAGDGQVIDEAPSPWGTHAILLVPIRGREHWIDTTAPLAGWNFLPRGDRDRVAYVTDQEGNINIRRTPPFNWIGNRTEQTTLVRVQTNGSSLCTRLARYYGMAALNRREEWMDEPPGERRRLMTAALLDANNRSKLLRLDLEDGNLEDFGKSLTAVVQFEIPGHFDGIDDREAGFTDSKVWSHLLAYHLGHDRKAPMNLFAPMDSYHRYIIHLPPAYRFATSERQRTFRSRWGFFKVSVEPDPNNPRRLQIIFHTRVTDTRIEPADFADYRRFHQSVYNTWRAWISITPTTNINDAVLLRKALAFEPGDLISTKILAKLLLKHDRHAEAYEILERLVEGANDNRDLWTLLVQSTTTLNQEKAVYQKMTKRFPENLGDALALGRLCVELRDYAEAEKVLKPLTMKGSNDVQGQAFYEMARAAFGRKKPKLALQHWQAVQRADKTVVDSAAGWQFAGKIHEALRQTRAAGDAYRKALHHDRHDRSLIAALVRLEIAAKRPRRALPWLRRYTVLAENDIESLVEAARFHWQMNRIDDAYDLALRARDIDFHADAQMLLGLISLQRGDYAKARLHLERANNNEEVMRGLMKTHLTLGNVTQARMVAVKADKLNKVDPETKAIVASIDRLDLRRKDLISKLIAVKKTQNAAAAVEAFVCAEYLWQLDSQSIEVKALLQKCFATKVHLGPAFALRGRLYLQRGHLRDAFRDAEEAIRLAPTEPSGFLLRGRIRFERMDKNALRDLQRAAELSKRKNAETLHWYAAALFEDGQNDKAIAVQREAIVLRPSDKMLSAQLDRFLKRVK